MVVTFSHKSCDTESHFNSIHNLRNGVNLQVLNHQTSSHHLLLEMSQLHIPKLVPPNHLPSMDEVSQIEVLEPIMVNGLALNPFADLSKKRVRGCTILAHKQRVSTQAPNALQER